MHRLVLTLGLAAGFAPPAAAQLLSQVVVSGLSSPVAFVQDPTLPDTQYVVQQGGRIRVVVDGQLSSTDFLNLTGSIASGGERGLLGLAFAPDYASSGRFFVNFTNTSGDTVIARFRRATGDARQADAGSRFDLRWPGGDRFIEQPFSNHNGGDLAFGPDGYLYIPLGDGGSGNDPGHRAQDPSTLLGKMLRIDVGVSDADPEGYDVPGDNPFAGTPGYLAEIWAFGYRNPWRFSFDSFGTGATGAMAVGDVGQGAREEVDYEPAGRGGRNYGWRNREGTRDNVTSLPPAYLPLTEPIYDYGRSVGATIAGGFVYRGAALPAGYRGRYFFADFISARVWSLGLTLDGAGEATVADIQEHTSELGGSSALGNISAFGRDANGELYIVGYGNGQIRRIASPAAATQVVMSLDAPVSGSVAQPFVMNGWAVDLGQTGSTTGVDAVHMWAFPTGGGPATFLGSAYGDSRPDVAAVYGPRYQNSGFSLTVNGLPLGSYRLSAFARSTVTGNFERSASVDVAVVTGPAMGIDTPAAGESVVGRFRATGWAIDRDSASGTGVDAVHLWAFPALGSPRFLGAAAYGSSRTDIGAAHGARFTNSGWTLTGIALPTGEWTLTAFARSTTTGTFRNSSSVTVQIESVLMAIDAPQAGAVTQPLQVLGWVADMAATSGTGVDAVHVWAFLVGGGGATFLGAATTGVSRPDVGAALGDQFAASGYQITATSLPPGAYDIVVYARSSVTGAFDAARVVRVGVN